MSNSAVERVARSPEEGGAALTEQIGVAQFVDRVFEVQPAQERVRRDFGGAQDVAAAIALDLRRTRSACARGGRNRPTPTGEPVAASGRRALVSMRHRDPA